MSPTTPVSEKGDLLYVKDEPSGAWFLVDTGAAVSIVPPSEDDQSSKQPAYDLLPGNGTAIATYSTKVLSLNLGLHKRLIWPFTVAKVTQPILGFDCLPHHDLVVDTKHHCLRHLPTNSVTQGKTIRGESPSIVHAAGSSRYSDLLNEFPALTSPDQVIPAKSTTCILSSLQSAARTFEGS